MTRLNWLHRRHGTHRSTRSSGARPLPFVFQAPSLPGKAARRRPLSRLPPSRLPSASRSRATLVGLRRLSGDSAWSTLTSQGFGSESSGMASRVGEPVARTNSGGGGGKDAGSFECNICLDLAQDPVVTLCGHLFCWPCLYEWFHVHAHSLECPVCKAVVEEEKLVPLYGRGDASTAPRARSVAGVEIPSRPTGQRPSTAQPPDHNQYPHQNPWFMGAGGAPVAGGRWGNYTFSAAIGGLFPLLSFQVHGFPQATAYGPAAGFPYGYGHSFHEWHGHGFPREAPQGQQVDSYLKILLLLVGVIVIATLIAF
ncbi:hypothetical protein PR202_gb04637 [Eleusine coracana subsp. coracana]|uniref:E3 ubiquitin-protein ligase RMA n=1 Tax=Eleusine coracana subsp. coracana TaxID=191504 RepID=A0AAV5E3E7_ELECO|nr:hypothetical protein PR202_gb04623 [Eleusine coracana subsp. coracana]GJN17559.1 hypothetical protein PR202_gb04637 [Eleusine coracana subsp. coracana]